MAKWQEVSTREELEQFLDVVGGFHDGVLKEVHWVNRDFVGDSLSLSPGQLAHARVLVQRQWKNPSAVEIFFDNIWAVSLDTVDFVFGSAAGEAMSSTYLGPARPVLVLQIEGSRITFERMFWRDASDWMGPEPRFGPFATPEDGTRAVNSHLP